jgi:lipopolysaccharide export LptBFGC system permease protein LptF
MNHILCFMSTVLIFSTVLACVTIEIPTPTITGEKTVIERQIVGDYRELEKDAWILSSVKTNIQRKSGTASIIGGDRILFRAMKIREFHMDKIRNYKNSGAMGEGNDGYIVYRQVSGYEKDRDLKGILLRVVEEENRARKDIFRRSLVRSGIETPGEKEMTDFGRIFAKEQRALAQINDWIQEENGSWVRKK